MMDVFKTEGLRPVNTYLIAPVAPTLCLKCLSLDGLPLQATRVSQRWLTYRYENKDKNQRLIEHIAPT